MFDFSIVTHWIDNLLRSVMPGWGAKSDRSHVVL